MEVVGNTLEHIGIGNNLLNKTAMAKQLKEIMNKCDWIKSESKGSLDSRDCSQNGRKTLRATLHIRNKYPKSIGSSKKLNPQRNSIPMKQWSHELKGNFQRKRYK
jgi:hypothetical protein